MAKNPAVDGTVNFAIPDSPYGVDISGCKFPGNLYGVESIVEGPFSGHQLSVGRSTDLRGARFSGYVGMSGAVIGLLHLKGAYFGGNVDFDGVVVQNAYFDDATFGAKVTMRNARFHQFVSMRGAIFKGEAHLTGIDFEAAALANARFEGRTYLSGSHFQRPVVLGGVYIASLCVGNGPTSCLTFSSCVDLTGLVVEEFLGGEIAARKISGTPESIPQNLEAALKNATHIYAERYRQPPAPHKRRVA